MVREVSTGERGYRARHRPEEQKIAEPESFSVRKQKKDSGEKILPGVRKVFENSYTQIHPGNTHPYEKG